MTHHALSLSRRVLLGCGLGLSTLLAANASHAQTKPLTSNPALTKFGTDVTFYLSFDHLPSLNADLSNGDPKPRDAKVSTNGQGGIIGGALLTTTDPVSYNTADNLDLSKPGALTMWVKPVHWQHDDDVPYIYFANVFDHGRQMMLSRMGKKGNEEALYVYGSTGVGGKDGSVLSGGTTNWADGQWHLLVANWHDNTLELSVDGGEPKSMELPGFKDAHGDPDQLILASPRDKNPYLVDEVLVLNRSLKSDEIKWMYDQFKPNRGGA